MQEKGFTLLELIIALALLGVLAAFALPDIISWSRSAKYRDSASNVLSALNKARTLAITTNLEHRVNFEIANNRYQVQRGNRYAESTAWVGAEGWAQWVDLPPEVALRSAVTCTGTANFDLHFNPNGSSNNTSICIMSTEGGGTTRKFSIGVNSTTGRAAINQKMSNN